MPMRLGPGPVFVYEWLTAARRWQLYVMRAGFIGTILIGLCLVWNQVSGNRLPDARVSIEELARPRLGHLPHDRPGRAVAGAAGGAGGDGRRRLPGQGAGHARPHAGHRPLQCRDRAGQAGRPADPGAGPDRLRIAGRGARLAAGRDRAAGPVRLVPDGDRLRLRRLLAGDDALGLRAEDPRSPDPDVRSDRPLGPGAGPAGGRESRADGTPAGSSPGSLGGMASSGRTLTTWSWCRISRRAGST